MLRCLVACALAACGGPAALWRSPNVQPFSPATTLGFGIERVSAIDDLETRAFTADTITVKLPHKVAIKRSRLEKRPNGFVWFGRFGSNGVAVFVVSANNRVTGTIRSATTLHQVIPSGKQHLLVERNWKIPATEHPPGFASIPAAPSTPIELAPSEPTTVGLVAVYTSAVVKWAMDLGKTTEAQAEADIAAMLQLAVEETNLANELSEVAVTFTVEVYRDDTLDESNDMEGMLYELVTDGDSVLDEVHTIRKTNNGDIALLIVACHACPEAHLGMANKVGAETAETAFAVMRYDVAQPYMTFAHEVGHVLGLRHDDDTYGVPFPHGHGFKRTDGRTIMATPCGSPDKCPRRLRWASPKAGPDGVWGTTTTNDSARALNERAPTAAKWR